MGKYAQCWIKAGNCLSILVFLLFWEHLSKVHFFNPPRITRGWNLLSRTWVGLKRAKSASLAWEGIPAGMLLPSHSHHLRNPCSEWPWKLHGDDGKRRQPASRGGSAAENLLIFSGTFSKQQITLFVIYCLLGSLHYHSFPTLMHWQFSF